DLRPAGCSRRSAAIRSRPGLSSLFLPPSLLRVPVARELLGLALLGRGTVRGLGVERLTLLLRVHGRLFLRAQVRLRLRTSAPALAPATSGHLHDARHVVQAIAEPGDRNPPRPAGAGQGWAAGTAGA